MKFIIIGLLYILSMTANADQINYPLFVADNGIKIYTINSDQKLLSFTIDSNFSIIDVITENRAPTDNKYYMYCWVDSSNYKDEENFKNKLCVNESGSKEPFNTSYEFVDQKIIPRYYTKKITANSLRINPHREKFKINYVKNTAKKKETYIYYTFDPITGKVLNNRKYLFTNK